MFNPCLLIPVFNNGATIPGVVEQLAAFKLNCLLVDDGSDETTRSVLEGLPGKYPWVSLRRRAMNGGKGAAVKTGLLWASELGHSHALQIDADGQHDCREVPRFLEASRDNSAALVLGHPIFGEDVPKSRLYGRQLSKFWVRLETLSPAIQDPLFGFRVYPVAAAVALIRRVKTGMRMDFDPEIAVRLCWDGVPVVNLATPVIYPEEGVSHFHMIWDNVRISWLHTRLTFGMILRLPRLITSKRR